MKIAILLLTLSPLACILDNGYGAACAQDLTNEIGYECEDDEYGTYISIVPCDYVPSCRTQCPNCGERMDCDEFEGHVWSCYYYCGFCGQSMTFDESISHHCQDSGMGSNSGGEEDGGSGSGGGGVGGDGPSGSWYSGSSWWTYYIDNNSTTIVINPPFLPMVYHYPLENEILFKNNLPAVTIKQQCRMDCVPTALASVMSLIGSEQTTSELKGLIEDYYSSMQDQDYDLCIYGIYIKDMPQLMSSLSFYSIASNEIVSNIDCGNPCVAVIDTDIGMHMLEIVGYFSDSTGVNAFQCINPGTGLYETHYGYEFEKYPNNIYTNYTINH